MPETQTLIASLTPNARRPSPTSRWPTSSANFPTSSTTCWVRPTTCSGRVTFILRSMAASTGIRACTCTGCWRACAGFIPDCRSASHRRAVRRALHARQHCGECAYLARPASRGFERTYGWAWLLELATELRRGDDAGSRRWTKTLAPLADTFVQRYLDYLPRQQYPLRAGVHSNSAFGLLFALDHARAVGNAVLEDLCLERARTWFGGDRNAPAAWEPSAPISCRRC